MKDLLKLLAAQEGQGEEMSEIEIQAKMDVLRELLEMAQAHSGKGIADRMQKLTVASPSKEGLMEGMEKAEEIVEEMPEEGEMPEIPIKDEEEDEEDEEMY